MDLEKLVEEIVKEIIEGKKEKEKKILFLDDDREKYKLKYEDFIMDWSEIEFIESNKDMEDIDHDILIVPQIDINDFISVSTGMSENKKTRLIVESFLNDIPVIFIREGLEYEKYADISNKNFFKMLKSKEEKLKSYGSKFINIYELQKELDSYKGKCSLENDSYSSLETQGLVTEDDVRKSYLSGNYRIVIGEKTIVTSLARDFIREHDMEIKTIK